MVYADIKMYFSRIGGEEREQSFSHLHFARFSPNRRYCCWYLVRKSIAEAKISSAENLAKQIVDEAHRNAESAKKEALLEAKEENHNLRQQAEDELRE